MFNSQLIKDLSLIVSLLLIPVDQVDNFMQTSIAIGRVHVLSTGTLYSNELIILLKKKSFQTEKMKVNNTFDLCASFIALFVQSSG